MHTGTTPLKKQAELFFPAEFADDFPVAMQISDKYGLVYVITKLGLLFVYDLETATAVYRNRISPEPIFLTAPSATTGGFYAVNRCTLLVQNHHLLLKATRGMLFLERPLQLQPAACYGQTLHCRPDSNNQLLHEICIAAVRTQSSPLI